MHIVNTIAEVRAHVRAARAEGKRIGFVPTMGNLHSGHISLIKDARGRSDYVVCSIFVNPTQFGINEDFDKYPRTLEADAALLSEGGCDLLFAPSASEMYPDGRSQSTTVSVSGITERLCGASRPGHFTGVATVVTKLFNIVQPDVACFGEKDFQQLAVIRRMTRELCLPVDVVGCPTARAEDGLALSSRNGYLGPEERSKAPMIYRTMCQLRDAILAGQTDYAMLTGAAMGLLGKSGFEPDYLEVCRQEDLQPAMPGDKNLVILVAARLGKTRLIDNLTIITP